MSAPVALAASLTITPPSQASVPRDSDRTAPPVRSVTVVQRAKQAIEGQRIGVTVRIAAPKQAKIVPIETRGEDIFGNPEWTTTKRSLVRGRAKVRLPVVVTGVNTQVFRAVAVYKDRKSATSKPFTVIVWRWLGLHEFDSYYSTPGVYDSEYLSFPHERPPVRGLADLRQQWGLGDPLHARSPLPTNAGRVRRARCLREDPEDPAFPAIGTPQFLCTGI